MRIWDKNFCLSHCGLGHRQFHEAQRRFVDGPPVDSLDHGRKHGRFLGIHI